MALRITELELRPGGLGIVFNNGVSIQATYQVVAGALTMRGLTLAQKDALRDFVQNRVDSSVTDYDPRFRWAMDSLQHVVEDLTPQLGGDLRYGGIPEGDGQSFYDTTGNPDARGQNAQDFQLSRASSDQVASGDISFIAGGRNNRAAGVFSFTAGGFGNIASDVFCHCEGIRCTATLEIGGFGYTHAHGIGAHANGPYAHAHGQDTWVQVGWSHVEGLHSIVKLDTGHAGGDSCQTQSYYAYAQGNDCWGLARFVSATGIESQAEFYGGWCHAAGQFTERGDGQHERITMYRYGRSMDWVELFLDGNSAQFEVGNDIFYAIQITITGKRSDLNEGCMFKRMVVISATNGSVVIQAQEIIGTDIIPGAGTYGDYDIQLRIDGDNFIVEGKHNDGGYAKEVVWVASIDTLKIVSSIETSPSISPSPSISLSLSPSISEFSLSVSISPSPSISVSPSISLSPSPSISLSASASPSEFVCGFATGFDQVRMVTNTAEYGTITDAGDCTDCGTWDFPSAAPMLLDKSGVSWIGSDLLVWWVPDPQLSAICDMRPATPDLHFPQLIYYGSEDAIELRWWMFAEDPPQGEKLQGVWYRADIICSSLQREYWLTKYFEDGYDPQCDFPEKIKLILWQLSPSPSISLSPSISEFSVSISISPSISISIASPSISLSPSVSLSPSPSISPSRTFLEFHAILDTDTVFSGGGGCADCTDGTLNNIFLLEYDDRYVKDVWSSALFGNGPGCTGDFWWWRVSYDWSTNVLEIRWLNGPLISAGTIERWLKINVLPEDLFTGVWVSYTQTHKASDCILDEFKQLWFQILPPSESPSPSLSYSPSISLSPSLSYSPSISLSPSAPIPSPRPDCCDFDFFLVQVDGAPDPGDPACCGDIFLDRCVDYSYQDFNGVCVFREGYTISNSDCLPLAGAEAGYWWYEVFYHDGYYDGSEQVRLLQATLTRIWTVSGFRNPIYFAQALRPIAEMTCADLINGWNDWDILMTNDIDGAFGSMVDECPNWDITNVTVYGKTGSCP